MSGRIFDAVRTLIAQCLMRCATCERPATVRTAIGNPTCDNCATQAGVRDLPYATALRAVLELIERFEPCPPYRPDPEFGWLAGDQIDADGFPHWWAVNRDGSPAVEVAVDEQQDGDVHFMNGQVVKVVARWRVKGVPHYLFAVVERGERTEREARR